MDERRETSSIRDLLTILFKYKKRIITTFFVVVLAVTAVSFLITPLYEARSSFLVKSGREYYFTPETPSETRPVSFAPPREELLNSEIQILTNHDLIERVVTAIGIKTLYPTFLIAVPKEEAISRFRQGLTAEVVKKTNVLEVAFRHKDPALAARSVNLLVDLFREKHLEVLSDPKSSFLEAQLVSYASRLQNTEERLNAFKREHGVFSLEEQRGLLLQQRMTLDSSHKDTQNKIGELTEKITSLKSQLKTISRQSPLASEPYRSTDDATTQLLTLKIREAELLQKYTPDNRLVINIRKEIALVQDFLKKQSGKVITGRNAIFDDIEKEIIHAQADLSSQKARLMTLSSQITTLTSDIETLDTKGKELSALKRDYAITEKNYQVYREKTEEARISDILDRQKMANITVIQKATIPTSPVKPKRGMNILIALALGPIAGVGLAFASELTRQDLSTPQAVEKRLAIPVISTVPWKE